MELLQAGSVLDGVDVGYASPNHQLHLVVHQHRQGKKHRRPKLYKPLGGSRGSRIYVDYNNQCAGHLCATACEGRLGRSRAKRHKHLENKRLKRKK